MQAPPPPLLPLLRSRLQADILTLILLNPDQEFTLTDIAARVGASVATAQREITRAEAAGVVTTRRVGIARLARAAPGPLTEPLTELLLRSFGPRQVLAEEFSGIEGVAAAYLFGSWAARYSGEPGAAPNDIDVLIIGTADRNALYEAADRCADRLGREVNPTRRSLTWWKEGTDAFHAELTARPLLPLYVDQHNDTGGPVDKAPQRRASVSTDAGRATGRPRKVDA